MAKGDFSHSGLASLRQEAGVTIEEIMDATKLSRRFVEAIDQGDFDQLPGGIFTVSYIRQYAETIGQDPDAIVAELRQKANPASGVASVHQELDPRPPQGLPRWGRFFSMG